MPIGDEACHLELHRSGDELLVMMSGVLRLSNGESTKNRLLELLDGTIQHLYINLAGVTEIDSAGLGVLVGLHMTSRTKKVNCRYLSPSPFQMRLFETTRITSIFSILTGIEAETIKQRLLQMPAE